MLKQAMPQEAAVSDIGTSSQLPPLNNLPQWSRINTLDKARYPKPFLKDRLQPLPNTQMDGDIRTESEGSLEEGIMDGSGVVGGMQNGQNANPSQRIQHLEKSIQFLQVQHQQVLVNLHEEIEKLKRENKELQFKIIMIQKSSPPGTTASRTASGGRQKGGGNEKDDSANERSPPNEKELGTASASSIHTKGDDLTTIDAQSAGTDSKLDELKVIFLEEEVRDVKRQLKEEKTRNNYLTHLLQQAEKQKLQTQQQNLLDEQTQQNQIGAPGNGSGGAAGSLGSQSTQQGQLPFNATMVPLQVRLPHKNPRPPTLAECEVIIRHLQQLNEKQAHELNQLKTDLRDVLYSHKWTPDAYLLAKAYVAEDEAKEAGESSGRLPRIPLKPPARKLPEYAYIQRDTVTLPALKQTMGNKAIERRKRTQVLQRSRVGREVMPSAIESTGNE